MGMIKKGIKKGRKEQYFPHNSGKRMTDTPEYRAWRHMKERCYCPEDKEFHNYGKRGIKVCDRWLESFKNFLEDMGKRPKGKYSLDRINPNGDYEPENCRWADSKTQGRNRRNNRRLTLNGETKCLVEWTEQYNTNHSRVLFRLKKGWTVEDALTIPKYGRKGDLYAD